MEFRLHLIADATYEISAAFSVTKASDSEQTETKELLEKVEKLYRGYDKSTDSLRYGVKPQKNNKRIFRIKCEEDRRIFTPVARDSHKWKRLYKKRTGVERINGRIDRDYQEHLCKLYA